MKSKSYCIKLDSDGGDFDLLLAATDGGAFEGKKTHEWVWEAREEGKRKRKERVR